MNPGNKAVTCHQPKSWCCSYLLLTLQNYEHCFNCNKNTVKIKSDKIAPGCHRRKSTFWAGGSWTLDPVSVWVEEDVRVGTMCLRKTCLSVVNDDPKGAPFVTVEWRALSTESSDFLPEMAESVLKMPLDTQFFFSRNSPSWAFPLLQIKR